MLYKFNEALLTAAAGQLVVLPCEDDRLSYADIPQFHALLAHPNAFVYQAGRENAPFGSTYEEAVQAAATGAQPTNKVALRLPHMDTADRVFYTHFDKPLFMPRILEQDREMLTELQQWAAQDHDTAAGTVFEAELSRRVGRKKELFEDETLEAVFVDIGGTLILDKGINLVLLETLRQLEDERPIVIFTSRREESHVQRLREAGICWPIAHKRWFAKATLEVVYDNDSPQVLAEMWGMNILQLHKPPSA